VLAKLKGAALYVLLSPLVVVAWLAYAFRLSRDMFMKGNSIFVCDTCGLEAKHPSHMLFEWFKVSGCDCVARFRMIHRCEHSPFGNCGSHEDEDADVPEFIRAAPVELIGNPRAPLGKKLYTQVLINRPDLARKGIRRWAELGRMNNK
tara:strand:+ start:633 stop:1076 length:444 start_codon:yes stop_codon:yes gene_type:complete